MQARFHNGNLYSRDTSFNDGSILNERAGRDGIQAKWIAKDGSTSPVWKDYADKWHRQKVFAGYAIPFTSEDIPDPKM